ncbi:cysteine--tRNA ligase [Alloscardovia theropitheci]|uniref:Cysteine--tRNA ligase n=1 Tax=Alloscardovia theropitheci TaxID=2496842 RepID=A0A4R0QT57_9BIFI|nr:cysteine--tRNA ligase [Alloscardovia theropitheci]TCD54688.1 cysteine--tRNA ligase [Alloscardovia theropitheci]
MTDKISNAARLQRVYNTATHSIIPFEPLRPGHVGIYVCGATVQSSPHVGHLRAAVAFDIVRRWLMKLGYEVTFIRNVTDIDDKILDKSAAAGQQWWQRAYIYEREFTHAYELLGVLAPTYEPRATGHIPEMIELIQRLIDRGHAYVVLNADGTPSGNVYFDVPSWTKYGELTHQESGTQASDATQSQADLDVESAAPSIDKLGNDKYNPVDAADLSEDKHSPRDFALWKAPKDTDPLSARWNTPFGAGRPGWHIECSAMSHKYLGDDFDIHGGGLDLRFPHHENEVAQSHAAGWGFAHVWMHSAWVTQKGEKMSKSLGNGLSLENVLVGYNPWMVRFALGSVQYRSMLEWSDQTLEEAKSAFDRVTGFLERAQDLLDSHDIAMPSSDDIAQIGADELPEAFVKAMTDDFNIPGALASIFSSVREGNSAIADNQPETVVRCVRYIRAMLDVLGLDPLSEQWAHSINGIGSSSSSHMSTEHNILDALVRSQLEARAQARNSKDFATADAIRNSLTAAGITIEDGPQGSTWKLTRE